MRRVLLYIAFWVNIADSVYALAFQSDIIIICRGNNIEFRLRIDIPTLLAFREHAPLLLYAVQTPLGFLMIIIEILVCRATLAKAHLLDIGNEQLNLIVGNKRDRIKYRGGPLVVHLRCIIESEVVKGFGVPVVITISDTQGFLSIDAHRVEVAVMIVIGQGVQLVDILAVLRLAS